MASGSPPGAPQSGGPVILELPLDKIRRPLMRTRANDPQKVKELMDSIREIGLQVPVRLFFLVVFFTIQLHDFRSCTSDTVFLKFEPKKCASFCEC